MQHRTAAVRDSNTLVALELSTGTSPPLVTHLDRLVSVCSSFLGWYSGIQGSLMPSGSYRPESEPPVVVVEAQRDSTAGRTECSSRPSAEVHLTPRDMAD